MEELLCAKNREQLPPVSYLYYGHATSRDKAVPIRQILQDSPLPQESPALTAFSSRTDPVDPLENVKEFVCRLNHGLMSVFRTMDLSLSGTSVSPATYATRQSLALDFSQKCGLHFCAEAVFRTHEVLGPGLLVAAVDGRSYAMHKIMSQADGPDSATVGETALSEVLICEYIVGSGQYALSGYTLDRRGPIRSHFQHKAFSGTCETRLVSLFEATNGHVSRGFWKALRHGSDRGVLHQMMMRISARLDIHAANDFKDRLNTVVNDKRIGSRRIVVL